MRLYTLQPNLHRAFFTGKIGSQQVLASFYDDFLLAIFFDEEGNLSKIIETVYDPITFGSKRETALQNWLDPMGFKMEPIVIKEFFLKPRSIGIVELDDEQTYFLAHEDEYPEEERSGYHEWVTDWRERGDFVFWWKNDYWCDKDGFIIAT